MLKRYINSTLGCYLKLLRVCSIQRTKMSYLPAFLTFTHFLFWLWPHAPSIGGALSNSSSLSMSISSLSENVLATSESSTTTLGAAATGNLWSGGRIITRCVSSGWIWGKTWHTWMKLLQILRAKFTDNPITSIRSIFQSFTWDENSFWTLALTLGGATSDTATNAFEWRPWVELVNLIISIHMVCVNDFDYF